MGCYYPLTGYKSKRGPDPETGIWKLEFNTKEGYGDRPQKVACGQCGGCRLERARRWAIRCTDEIHEHLDNQYITLTYNDANIPQYGSLHKPDLQKFWKRLRKNSKQKIRFYACGEYGDETQRPHYHAIVFGLYLDDLEYFKTDNGNKLYTSEFLLKQWKMGHITIGQANFESAGYVARYILKKQLGKNAISAYERVLPGTGEIINLVPEFTTMSIGIGKTHYEKYSSDIYQPGTDGKIIIRGGMQSNPPPYYDMLYARTSKKNEQHLRNIKKRRALKQISREHDNTEARLATKQSIKENTVKKRLLRNKI